MGDLIGRLRALARYEHDDVSVADEAADALESTIGPRLRAILSVILDRLRAGEAEVDVTRDYGHPSLATLLTADP